MEINIELLKKSGIIRQFKKGEFICFEKEERNTAFLLLKGRVEIIVGSFSDNSKAIARLDPGVIFGEMSLLENKPRTASVRASEECMVLEIQKDNFLSLMQIEPDIAFGLLRTLLNRMELSMEKIKYVKIGLVSEIKRDKNYVQIKNLTVEQFKIIVEKDSKYALRLLKFLSYNLSLIDSNL